MATSSHQTTDATGTGATSTPTTGSTYTVIPHNHKAPCWENYDLVKLFDGTEKARHRLCGKLFGSKGNSTLSGHHPKCESNQNPEFTQARIDETCRTWNYDQVLQREMQMKCIISRGWPYNTIPLVSYCYGPNKRRQDFCKFGRGQGLKYLKPAVDMPIRWNSTYKMLKRAFRQRGVLMEFHNSRNGPVNTLSSTDWTRIEELLSILKCFYKATKRFSGVYYPTTPLVLGEFYLITMTFVKWQDNEIWGPVIFQMREKFLKYYEEMPQMFCCAAALDPKIGVDGVESLIECINCNLGISTDATSASIQKFNQILNAFYDHYETLYGAKPRDIPVETGSSRDVALQLAISRKKSKTISSSSELAKYKMTDFVGEQSDILEFWKTRSCHYPVMAIMARDILTVQASTVASESAFSFSGRILNERRSRLSLRLSGLHPSQVTAGSLASTYHGWAAVAVVVLVVENLIDALLQPAFNAQHFSSFQCYLT
ncbi:hypothetical protein POM88_049660 [Heracleum sosnowskyi]|uniref:Transposase n=1 Tax=Heracleum sosnowskyi TaxID=360622 RepID=A0AAD8M1L4_9APIA|nr:hypothetical protein POM88_049660 [Heracleum sosnowskyi]